MSSAQSATHRSMSNCSKASKERRITATLSSRCTPGSMAGEEHPARPAASGLAAADEELLAVAAQELDGTLGELERVGDDAAVALGHGGDDLALVLGDEVGAVTQPAAVESGEVGELIVVGGRG